MDRLRRQLKKLLPNHKDHEAGLSQLNPAGHPLSTLPSLPTPRRPITAVPPSPQPTSSFFTLPPELRQQIYRLLLSSHEYHIDMRYTKAETSSAHSTKGVVILPTRHWRWTASTCHRHPDAQVMFDRCGWGGPFPTACYKFDTSCCVGKEVMGLLLSCRMMYREAVQVLYAENTFHITTGALLLYTNRLLPQERSGAITRLIYRVTAESMLTYAEEHLGLEPGVPAYTALLTRIPEAFPALKNLQIVIDAAVVRSVWPGLGNLDIPLPEETRSAMTEMLLKPVDLVVQLYQEQLKECVIVLDHMAFDHMLADHSAVAERPESVDGQYLQFWRPISEEDGPANTGYWVRSAGISDARAGWW